MNTRRNPILYKGEKYSAPIIKKGGPPKEPKISYDEARKKIISDIDTTAQQIVQIPRNYRMPNEIVLCLRLQPEFSAKSYYPGSLFEFGHYDSEMKEVGTRIWRPNAHDSIDESKVVVENDKVGKLLFVRTSETGLQKFKERLNNAGRTKQFEVDVRKLQKLDLLTINEQVSGFEDSWKEGFVEAVIHPFELDNSLAYEQFIAIAKQAGVNSESIRLKQYEDGITFVSLFANKEIVNSLSGYNPLRTVHPMAMRDLPEINRSAPIKGLPKCPVFKNKPEIKLGIIDGGYKAGNTYIDNYVEVDTTFSELPIEQGLEHGTLVSSAALFGPLNSYLNSDTLPEPVITVKNFRVLSKNNIGHIDLYGAIDEIEKIIPLNKDISVYNISFGPRGGINDDNISRFTYSCDLLSKKHEILFCTAVGNDGDIAGYDRIQAPSDIVNGLGIGAFTISNNKKIHASYSCKGPGREGNKLKPDIVGFGGCERYPIQLISPKDGFRVYTSGTSFSTPLIAATAAQIIGRSKKTIDVLVARALIIHSTKETNKSLHCNLMGHGALPDDILNLVSSPDKSYTLIYEDEIPSGKYIQYSIPWIEGLINQGTANFRWTTAVLTNVDPLSTDDYTTCSIQTAFYPNSNKFKFTKDDKSTTLDIEEDADAYAKLITDGWKKSEFPVSKAGPQPFEKENDLRSDLKWDSIDYREKNIRAKDVKKPMFHVHSLKRGTRVTNGKVKFALILSLGTPKANIDIYPRIISSYHNILPLQVEVENRIKVTV